MLHEGKDYGLYKLKVVVVVFFCSAYFSVLFSVRSLCFVSSFGISLYCVYNLNSLSIKVY